LVLVEAVVEPVVAELVVAELVVAELVEASKHRNDHRKKLTKPMASTGSAIGECQ